MDINNLDDLNIEIPKEFGNIPVFVVGGAVRDKIMGEEPSDIDLMVAEVSPSEMRSRGFKEIDSPNNDTFGVFQDSLGREVAIAREEESTGDGHTDFSVTPVESSVEASEAVHRDLKRRDLTINSMAFDVRWGILHDPQSGVMDLMDGIVRATSEKSFKEDPLRIIRAARFASRMGFEIEPDTQSVMQESADGIRELPNERIRMELEKALVQSEQPSIFFDTLKGAGVLETVFPSLSGLTNVPAGPEPHHQEGSAFEHTMLVLDEMANIRPNDELALLMALVHDFGKAATPEESLPNHPNHGSRGINIVRNLANSLSMSNEQEKAMVDACRFHMRIQNIEELRESTVIETLQQTENPARLVSLARADSMGRVPGQEFDAATAFYRFANAEQAMDEWTGQRLIDEGYSPDEMGGEEFGSLLRQRRVERMRELEK